jgi:hypothetical protein
MGILLILVVYTIPVLRLLWLVLSKKLKQKIVKREPFVYACFIYGLLSLISGIVILAFTSLKTGGASGVPLALLLPIQLLLIIVAETLVGKSKSTSLNGYKGYRESNGDEWFK